MLYGREKFIGMVIVTLLLSPLMAKAQGNGSVDLSGDMLPAERWGVRLESRFGIATNRYDEHGKEVGVADELDNIDINADLLSVLSIFGAGASLGVTDVSSTIKSLRERLFIGYGVSERVTLVSMLPWAEVRNEVDFDVTPGDLALNPAFDPTQPVSAGNLPFVAAGAVGPASAADINKLLTEPVYGYEYKPIESVTTSGFQDPEFYLRWLAYQGDGKRLILTPGIRLGMSENDDPDNFLDVRLYNGSDDIMMRFDYSQRLMPALDAQLTYRHTWQLMDHRRARALAEGESLVSANRKERMERDLGDVDEVMLEARYRHDAWRYRVRLSYQNKKQDNWTSPSGQDVRGLEQDTDRIYQHYWLGLTWNGVSAWRDGAMPLPLIIAFDYRDVYKGKNVLKSKDYYLTLTVMF